MSREIIAFLVDHSPELLSSRDQEDGTLSLHVACRRGASFTIVQSLVNRYKALLRQECNSSRRLAALPGLLDTIFLLMKLCPDLVYR
jgi:hypothetical protein